MSPEKITSGEREIISRFDEAIREVTEQARQAIDDMLERYRSVEFPCQLNYGKQKVASYFEDNIRKETDRIRELIDEFNERFKDAGYSWFIIGSSLHRPREEETDIKASVLPYRENEPPVDELDITEYDDILRWRDAKFWETEMNIAQIHLLHSKKILSLYG